MKDIEYNILNAKVDLKLAVNRSLYMKGIITEEMYIKANEMLIKTTATKGLDKNSNDSIER